MRPWIQGSAAREEDEHPYELLLTAETKKLASVDGRTKGRAPTPAPGRNNSERIFFLNYLFIYLWLRWAFVAARGLLIVVASLVAEHEL